MAITQTMTMTCPPEVAFDLMSDVRNEARWNDGTRRVEMLTDGPVGRGSRFVTDIGPPLGEIDVTIAVFDRPERLEFDSTSRAMDLTITFRISSSSGVTTMVGDFVPSPKGVMRLLFPLLKPMIARDMAKNHAKFEALCEATAQRT